MTNVTTINSTISMTSFDFLNNFINPAREAAGQKPVRNNDFIARIEDELDDLGDYETFVNDKGSRHAKYYTLSHDQMMIVGMRESKSVRKAVLAKLKELTSENKLLIGGMKAIQVADNIEEAHGIAAEVLGRRELLRQSYNTEVKQILTQSFENGTSEGGRDAGMVICNHMKLVSIIATGMTPKAFKEKHNGMNPRDYSVAANDLELISSLSRAEAKVLALSEAGMSYSEIKELLVK